MSLKRDRYKKESLLLDDLINDKILQMEIWRQIYGKIISTAIPSIKNKFDFYSTGSYPHRLNYMV